VSRPLVIHDLAQVRYLDHCQQGYDADDDQKESLTASTQATAECSAHDRSGDAHQ
jgi:hypothetical protein